MKAWPGYLAKQGDNPPWNVLAMNSLGMNLADNGSENVTPTAEQLLALKTERNGSAFVINPSSGSYTAWARLKIDAHRLYNLYGTIVRLGAYFAERSSGFATGSGGHLMHRVELVAGLAGHNTGSSPSSFSLTEIPALIDNQPYGAAASTLTTLAKSFSSADTGYCEVGFQVGAEANGIFYTKAIDTIAVVVDQVDDFKGLLIYKSYDGSTWYPVLKANYNSNGWVGGEYVIKGWRSNEVGGSTENCVLVALGSAEKACYFKVAKSNAAGKTFNINEVYGFLHQPEVLISSDLINYRSVLSTQKGSEYLHDIAKDAIVRSGAGPVGPSGSTAVFSELKGVWEDTESLSWYDATLGMWVKANGTVYDPDTGTWISSASLSAINSSLRIPIDAVTSRETSPVVRQLNFEIRPFNPRANSGIGNELITLFEIGVYNITTAVNSADSDGVKKTFDRIRCHAGEVGPHSRFRIYNDGALQSVGCRVWVDPDGQLARDVDSPEDYAGYATSQEIPDGVTSLQLADASRSITAVFPILNEDRSGVGALGDSSVEIASRHLEDDTTNTMTESDAPGTEGGPYPLLYALCLEIKDHYNTHRVSTTFHREADTVYSITSADPSSNKDLAGMITLLNEAKTKYNSHCASSYHKLPDQWNTVSTATATDEPTAAALANAIKDAFDLHMIGNIEGWTEVASSPGAGEYAVDYDTGIIEFGATTQEGNIIRNVYYMSEGARTARISEDGVSEVQCPNVLTLVNDEIPVGGYAEIHVWADLTGITDERERPFKLLMEYDY